MADNIKNSEFFKGLVEISKEQGTVTLLDLVDAMKKDKEAASIGLDAIIEALNESGIHYSDSEDEAEPEFSDGPSAEDLENFNYDDDDELTDSDEDDVSLENDFDEEPSDDELNAIDDEDDEESSSVKSKSEDDDD